MSDTRYCYPNSDVLINKLGIKEQDKLHTFERKLTMLRLSELMNKPISGQFNFQHLKNIHAYIFQDIYDWAGKNKWCTRAKSHFYVTIQIWKNWLLSVSKENENSS